MKGNIMEFEVQSNWTPKAHPNGTELLPKHLPFPSFLPSLSAATRFVDSVDVYHILLMSSLVFFPAIYSSLALETLKEHKTKTKVRQGKLPRTVTQVNGLNKLAYHSLYGVGDSLRNASGAGLGVSSLYGTHLGCTRYVFFPKKINESLVYLG